MIKSQVILEYMVVVGISIMLIIGMGYFFFLERSRIDQEMNQANTEQVGMEIAKFVEEMYFSTGAGKVTTDLKIPPSVNKLYIEDETYLVMEHDDGTVNKIDLEYPAFTFFREGETYTDGITFKRIDNHVVICALSPGDCHRLSPESNCTDGIDNDLDRRTDGEDSDCCPDDDDGDGYPDMYNNSVINTGIFPESYQVCWPLTPVGVRADDCNDSNPNAYPGAFEICGNNIDENCNGIPDDGCLLRTTPDCNGGFCFYLETGTPGDNPIPKACKPGYQYLLSLYKLTNSHVENGTGVMNYGFDLCYAEKLPTCLITCKMVNTSEYDCNPNPNGQCTVAPYVGWTKIMGIFDGDANGGSHIQAHGRLTFSEQVLCQTLGTSCGQMTCEVDASCDADETCILGLYNEENTHATACDQGTKNICCKVTS